MHRSSIRLMRYFRDKYCLEIPGAAVLDVGSRVIKTRNQLACYRSLFEPKFDYTGMDLEPGLNVDLVGYHSIVRQYDIVISGQVMEHVRRPWEWLDNLVGYFTKYICIIAPNTWPEHRYPIDTYRYYPDGMRDLFDYAGIKDIEIFKKGVDTIGIGTHFG